MDNSTPNKVDTEFEPQPETHPEGQAETPPEPEAQPETYINERIKEAFDRADEWLKEAKAYYQRSARLQKVSYQGKFLPAFWTVATIFSLLVNIILIGLLISLGHHFFELKSLVAEGLVGGLSQNLALMDKAHIVTTVPVTTTVELHDNLPVEFTLPIKENMQVTLLRDTPVNATTYINLAPVPLTFNLPAGTPIQFNLDITVPVSQSLPINLTVPVAMQVPLDIAIDQTDLHQSIVGLQSAIEPYQALLGSSYNTPDSLPFCKPWYTGWLCDIVFGKQ